MASSATVRQCGRRRDRCVDQASSDATRGRHGEGTERGQAIPAWFFGDADRVRRGNYASGRHGGQSIVIDLALSGFVGRPLRLPSNMESPLTSYSRGAFTPPQAGCDGFGVRRGPGVAA